MLLSALLSSLPTTHTSPAAAFSSHFAPQTVGTDAPPDSPTPQAEPVLPHEEGDLDQRVREIGEW